MTPEQRLWLAAFLAIIVWVILQALEREARCGYCGRLGSHKQDCPWDLEQR